MAVKHKSLKVVTLPFSTQIPGMVNVDFADVRAIMTGAGSSLMGQGYGTGKDRAAQAALQATSSPLLDIGIDKATGVVWNITGPPDMTLFEVRCFIITSKEGWPCRLHLSQSMTSWCRPTLLPIR